MAGLGVSAALAAGYAARAGAESSVAPVTPATSIRVQAASPVDAGRYLVTVSGCNDCHTPGYMQKDGHVPETEWLTGSPVGWQGPWGTSYASNLRLLLQDMDEDTWVQYARIRDGHPPMPWWALKTLSDEDLRSLYQYVRSLPVAGEPAPAFVPPGQPVSTPYISLMPQMPAPVPGTPPSDTPAAPAPMP
ncbi:MAG: cytochrome C [Lentisphaerae bacterium]|nr:cytochrome C [Lentisphaerota bacterium]